MRTIETNDGNPIEADDLAIEMQEQGNKQNQERARTFYLASIAASKIAQTEYLKQIATSLNDLTFNGIRTHNS